MARFSDTDKETIMMPRLEIEIAPAGDDEAEVELAAVVRAAVNRARVENRMTFAMMDEATAAAIVPVGTAVAMEPSVVRLSGDTCWTELPATGMFCAAGYKITQINWDAGPGGHPVGRHADDSVCDHMAHPDLG
jgi:hypothetical protein